jgi:hypothetical protein
LIASKFRVRSITSEEVKFDVIVGSLPCASLQQVLDVMEHPNATTPNSTLKTRLMSAHELTKFQRIEALFKVEPLGARKPSELLAQMLELCPRGAHSSSSSSYSAFLKSCVSFSATMRLRSPATLASYLIKSGRYILTSIVVQLRPWSSQKKRDRWQQ